MFEIKPEENQNLETKHFKKSPRLSASERKSIATLLKKRPYRSTQPGLHLREMARVDDTVEEFSSRAELQDQVNVPVILRLYSTLVSVLRCLCCVFASCSWRCFTVCCLCVFVCFCLVFNVFVIFSYFFLHSMHLITKHKISPRVWISSGFWPDLRL